MKRLISPDGKVESVLSPLEQDVLALLWRRRRMRVREIYQLLKDRRKLALSSVAVILDRLHARKVVGRDIEKGRGGVRYIYFPLSDKETFEKNAVETAVNKLIAQFGPSAVSYFNERFSK